MQTHINEDGIDCPNPNIIFDGSIKDYLTSITQRYGGGVEGHEFVLRYGRLWQPAALPANIRRGMPKECYSNAAQLAFSRPDLIYIEGFARCKAGPSTPFEHAWCADADGKVVDPTWTSGTEYFGVPFRTAFVREFTHKTNSWTVIAVWKMEALLALPPGKFLHP